MDYICNECQTRYGSGPYDNVPSGIKWSDGHTCDPVPVKCFSGEVCDGRGCDECLQIT